VVALIWGCPVSRALAFDLITPGEAARPDDRYEEGDRPGPLLGPRVQVHGDLKTTSPFEVTIQLTPRGGATINVDSLQVSYRKKPPVNLLPRMRPFITQDGRMLVIRLRDARVPVGRHQILLRVEDSLGQLTQKALDLDVLAAP
jgi:hypothetical protein